VLRYAVFNAVPVRAQPWIVFGVGCRIGGVGLRCIRSCHCTSWADSVPNCH